MTKCHNIIHYYSDILPGWNHIVKLGNIASMCNDLGSALSDSLFMDGFYI